jgi:predicted kinase
MFALVGGWPGSGKSTLAEALATEMSVPLLAKDEIKEALMDALGRPASIAESRRIGEAAVRTMLAVARRCPAAILDSTWFEYTRPLLADLPGPIVEIRCLVPVELARSRYRARAAGRHSGHLDADRTEDELWAEPVRPLGLGPLIEVDTSGPVDIGALAARLIAVDDSGYL